MWLELPWLPVSALICLLCVVFIREVFLSRSFAHGDPERGMAVFNLCVLFVAIAAMLIGVRFLSAHEQVLKRQIPVYAHARYAPEREVFREGVFNKTWIYISPDQPNAIVKNYQELMQSGAITVIIDASKSGSPKLLLESKNRQNIFLTIEKENNRSVLYYSVEGEVRTVSTGGSR